MTLYFINIAPLGKQGLRLGGEVPLLQARIVSKDVLARGAKGHRLELNVDGREGANGENRKGSISGSLEARQR